MQKTDFSLQCQVAADGAMVQQKLSKKAYNYHYLNQNLHILTETLLRTNIVLLR